MADTTLGVELEPAGIVVVFFTLNRSFYPTTSAVYQVPGITYGKSSGCCTAVRVIVLFFPLFLYVTFGL